MVTTDHEIAAPPPPGTSFAGRSRLSCRCPTRVSSAIGAVASLAADGIAILAAGKVGSRTSWLPRSGARAA
jgi:hypothetical protein